MTNPMTQLLRFILSHAVLIGFIGFALVAVLGREALFGISDEQVAVLPSPSQDVPAVIAPVREQVMTADMPEPVGSAPNPASPNDADLEAEQEEIAPQVTDVQTPVAAVAVPKRPDTTTIHSSPVTADKLLQKARRAFWDGALEQAQQYYLGYLERYPTDANVFGELGNLYQSMGRPSDALDAYFEAGLRFKATGEQEQLRQIAELFKEAGDRRLQQLQP